MSTTYWSIVFTPWTWREFIDANAGVMGFCSNPRAATGQVRKGDCFICYLARHKRWVGALEVTSSLRYDTTTVWKGPEPYPNRFDVRLLVQLPPSAGIPVDSMAANLQTLKSFTTPQALAAFFVTAPRRLYGSDGEAILSALRVASLK